MGNNQNQLQGNPGVFDPRNPTLVPNVDSPRLEGVAQMPPVLQQESPADMANTAGNFGQGAPNRVDAVTPAVTIGGTITNNDTAQTKFTSPLLPGGSRTVTATFVTGDTTTTCAEKIADSVNTDPVCQRFGIWCEVDAGAAPSPTLIKFHWPSILGNFPTWAITVTGSATETATPASGSFSGVAGTGPVIAYANFQMNFSGVTKPFFAGKVYEVDYVTASLLHTAGAPVM